MAQSDHALTIRARGFAGTGVPVRHRANRARRLEVRMIEVQHGPPFGLRDLAGPAGRVDQPRPGGFTPVVAIVEAHSMARGVPVQQGPAVAGPVGVESDEWPEREVHVGLNEIVDETIEPIARLRIGIVSTADPEFTDPQWRVEVRSRFG